MAGSNEPQSYRVTETPEEVEAFWHAQEPIMAAKSAAAEAVLPTVIGLRVEDARQVVADEAASAGVSLTLRIIEPNTRVNEMFQFGRITALVRDGVIESAHLG